MELQFKLTLKSGRIMTGSVTTLESPGEWLARNMNGDIIAFGTGNKAHAVFVREIEAAEVKQQPSRGA